MDLTTETIQSDTDVSLTSVTISDTTHYVLPSTSASKISGATNSVVEAVDQEINVGPLIAMETETDVPSPVSQSIFDPVHQSSTPPVIVKPLHSNDPIRLDTLEEENTEKSAYEIAVEALCLMKQSGNYTSSLPLNNTEYIEQTVVTNGSADLPVESEVIIDSTGDHSDFVKLSMEDSHDLINISNSQKKVVKYVLVPESVLLHEQNSSKVSNVGKPLLYMVPNSNAAPQKVYKLSRPQPRVIKLHKKMNAMSGASVLQLQSDDRENLVQRSDLEDMNAYSVQSPQNSIDGDDVCSVGSLELKTKSARGKRNSSKKHDTLKFPPCVICAGEASGLHYGCNTCEACKNFFRRCLLRKSSTPFVCHSGNNCEISFKKNKNNCSACRLNKCTEAGMAKEKCKMGRYTALMRTETIKKVRKLEGKDTDALNISPEVVTGSSVEKKNTNTDKTGPAESIYSIHRQNFDAESIQNSISETLACEKESRLNNVVEVDDSLIEHLVKAMHEIKPWGDGLCSPEARKELCRQHYERYQEKVKMFGSMNEVSMAEYHTLLKQFGIDIDGQWESFKELSPHWDSAIGKFCAFMKNVPNFNALSYDDQSALLKSTHCDYFVVLMHEGYVHEYGVYLEVNGKPFHINESGDRFVTKSLVLLSCDIDIQMQNMCLLDFEKALLLSIVSMSPDRCKLQNSNLVESTQLQLTNLLINQLNATYGPVKGRQRFTSFIDILTKIRELSHMYMKEYRSLCNDEMIKKDLTNIDIVLPEDD
ncbi:hypothetical protein ACF0H5_008227 [Mactra antiquata]